MKFKLLACALGLLLPASALVPAAFAASALTLPSRSCIALVSLDTTKFLFPSVLSNLLYPQTVN